MSNYRITGLDVLKDLFSTPFIGYIHPAGSHGEGPTIVVDHNVVPSIFEKRG